MSKRKLSKQQRERIKAQENKLSFDNERVLPGLVIARFGQLAEIESESAERIICAIRPNIPDIVAGDRISWVSEGVDQGVVVSCLPRYSSLYRSSPRRKKLIAANVTQLMIVIAPEPAYSAMLLDSYLVVAELNHIKPTIVINKTDLPCDVLLQEISDIYRPLGYNFTKTSRDQQQADTELTPFLNHEVSVFVGQSGVGKSSIINRLLPHETLQTANISTIAQLGKHTTSQSRYYHLPQGGALIDSPGIREFGLWGTDLRTLCQGFIDIAPITQKCQFRDCNHETSRGCAVMEAVEKGDIHPSRYRSLIQLAHQFEKR
jgi:ribosome biogenesis GTPase